MAINIFQVQAVHRSGIPRDNSINVLYYEVNLPDTVVGTMDEIAAAYFDLAPWFQTSYSLLRIKSYDAGGGPPTNTKTYAFQGTGGLCPNEVALCLSYSATDGVTGAPRFRGRIYLPLTGTDERPTSPHQLQLLDFGERLASVGFAGNTTWMMRSALGTGTPAAPAPVYRKIESISVDNAWDTQRRRGMAPTVRNRRDVQ